MDTPLLPEIESFLLRHAMAESTFGRLTINDWKFVRLLRRGRRTFRDTEDRVRRFMRAYDGAHPVKPTAGSPFPVDDVALQVGAGSVCCGRSVLLQRGTGA